MSTGRLPLAVRKVGLEEGDISLTHAGKTDSQRRQLAARIAHMLGQQVSLTNAGDVLEMCKVRTQGNLSSCYLPALTHPEQRHAQKIFRRRERGNPVVYNQEMVLIIMRQLIPRHLRPGYEVIYSETVHQHPFLSGVSPSAF